MTRTEYDVVALGELLIDFTAQGAGADGYPLMAAHPGGAPANFLAAIARLGGRTALLSKVGADAFGTMLTGTLREVGVDTRGVVVAEDAFTTLAFVTLAARGERSFSFARKPGADTQLRAEELDLSLIEKTKAFHFGTLSLTDEPARGATQRAVAYAKERGKLITFDPNLRPPLWRSPDDAREQMLWGLGQADVVKISDNEVKFLFGLSPREGAAYIRGRFGTQLVFVTCGADGCEFASLRAQGMWTVSRALQSRTPRARATFSAAARCGGCSKAARLPQRWMRRSCAASRNLPAASPGAPPKKAAASPRSRRCRTRSLWGDGRGSVADAGVDHLADVPQMRDLLGRREALLGRFVGGVDGVRAAVKAVYIDAPALFVLYGADAAAMGTDVQIDFINRVHRDLSFSLLMAV